MDNQSIPNKSPFNSGYIFDSSANSFSFHDEETFLKIQIFPSVSFIVKTGLQRYIISENPSKQSCCRLHPRFMSTLYFQPFKLLMTSSSCDLVAKFVIKQIVHAFVFVLWGDNKKVSVMTTKWSSLTTLKKFHQDFKKNRTAG